MEQIYTKYLDSSDGLKIIAEEWNSIEGRNQDVQFFQFLGWFRAYLHNLAEKCDSVGFIVGYKGDKVHMILPVEKHVTRKFGFKIIKLTTPKHTHLPLFDVVCDEAQCTGIMGEMLQSMQKQTAFRWDVLYCHNLPQNSKLIEFHGELPLNLIKQKTVDCSYIRCDSNKPHTDCLTTKFKRNLRRLSNRASKIGPLSFSYLRKSEEIEQAFDTFLELEGSGWKGHNGTRTAIKYDDKLLNFYKGIVRDFSKHGNCQINLMKIGDTYAAGHLCLIVNGVANLIKIGYEQKFEKVAPGNLLLLDFIEKCTQDPLINTISFVTGPVWTRNWCPERLSVHKLVLCNRTMKGYLSFMSLRCIDQIKNIVSRFNPKKIFADGWSVQGGYCSDKRK